MTYNRTLLLRHVLTASGTLHYFQHSYGSLSVGFTAGRRASHSSTYTRSSDSYFDSKKAWTAAHSGSILPPVSDYAYDFLLAE